MIALALHPKLAQVLTRHALRRALVTAGAIVVVLALLWIFWWRDRIVLRIEVPGATASRVHVELTGSYHDGPRYETRELLRTYLPANQRNVIRIRTALPLRYDSLRVNVFHPAVRGAPSVVRSNPHWWRTAITLTPLALPGSPKEDSIAIGAIERHYDDFERLYIQQLGAHEAATQSWPHLEALRMMIAAASFRLEKGALQPPDLQAERLQKLMDRWMAIEGSLRASQFEPCTEPGVSFRNEIPGVAPACGLKAMLPPP